VQLNTKCLDVVRHSTINTSVHHLSWNSRITIGFIWEYIRFYAVVSKSKAKKSSQTDAGNRFQHKMAS